jgi:hypothetical protein
MPFILLAGSFSTPSTAATTLPSIFSFHLTLHHEAVSLYFFLRESARHESFEIMSCLLLHQRRVMLRGDALCLCRFLFNAS